MFEAKGITGQEQIGTEERVSTLEFDRLVRDIYEDCVSATATLRQEWLNAGIASRGLFLRKIADLVLQQFRRVETSFEQAYITRVQKLSGGITPAREEWIRRSIHSVIESQLSRGQAMAAQMYMALGAAEPEYHQYNARLRDVASMMEQELDRAVTLSILKAEESQGTTTTDDNDDLVPLLRAKVFHKDLPTAFKCTSNGDPLSLLIFDLDHFKKVNDTYGHAVGNEVLIGCGETISKRCRNKGKAYRFGGEEFAVLLPNFTTAEAVALAESIRIQIESTPMGSLNLSVTTSIGVATAPDHALQPPQLLEVADRAMYSAKKLGRNLVRIAGESSEFPQAHVVHRRPPQRSVPSLTQKWFVRCTSAVGAFNVQLMVRYSESGRETRLVIAHPDFILPVRSVG